MFAKGLVPSGAWTQESMSDTKITQKVMQITQSNTNSNSGFLERSHPLLKEIPEEPGCGSSPQHPLHTLHLTGALNPQNFKSNRCLGFFSPKTAGCFPKPPRDSTRNPGLGSSIPVIVGLQGAPREDGRAQESRVGQAGKSIAAKQTLEMSNPKELSQLWVG